MKLEDTISLMCSDDYKDRLKAEYLQASIRLGKLNAYILEMPDQTSIEGQHMREQRNAMKYYVDALKTRLVDNGIPLKHIEYLLKEG